MTKRTGLSRIIGLLWLLMAATACSAEQAAADEPYKEGQHYKALARSVPTSADEGKVEVAEFFLYSCPHCYHFESILGEWAANPPAGIDFKTIPASFGPNAELHAKAHYTAINLGVKDPVHRALFDAIHEHKRRLDNEAAIEKVFTANGVSAEDFKKTFNSFTVDNQVRRGEVLGQAYAVTGVPALAVAGKYWITAAMAGSHENMLKVAEFLAKKELAK